MGLYDRLAATASRMLNDRGRGVQYLRTSAVHDLATAQSTTILATTSVNAVDFDFVGNLGERYKGAEAGQVITGDRVVYVSGNSLTSDPKPEDKIILGTKTYRVISLLEKIAPAGTPVLYVVKVRV